MTSQQEADALLRAFWRERERKKSNKPQSAWEALMPPKAPALVGLSGSGSTRKVCAVALNEDGRLKKH